MLETTEHPISVNHPDYAPAFDRWKRCRDAVGGTDTVKAEGTTYLPALGSHKKQRFDSFGDDKYQAYLDRALWYNATKRTVLGLSGAANLNKPNITGSSKFDEQARKIAGDAQFMLSEQLTAGRLCILVTQDPDTNKVYHTTWTAESIVNWGFYSDIGKNKLKYLVLQDSERNPGEDAQVAEDEIVVPLQQLQAKTRTIRHYYWLQDAGLPTARAFYAKFAKVTAEGGEETDDWVLLEDTVKPLAAIGNKALKFLPAVLVDVDGINQQVIADPVLLDLADVNFSHYRNSADLEHGRHWVALPTACVTLPQTHDKNKNPYVFAIGGEEAWVLPHNSKAWYLEFSGAGLGHIEKGMEAKQRMMAVLGARLLEEAKESVEASETLKTRLTGDRSVLHRIAGTLSTGITIAAKMATWMLAASDDNFEEQEDKIELDTDFLDKSMSPEEAAYLLGMLQSNAISYETFFAKLKEGHVIPEERTIEEESNLIDLGRPGPGVPDALRGDPNELDDKKPDDKKPDDKKPDDKGPPKGKAADSKSKAETE